MTEDFEIVNRAFSKQSVHYDKDDRENLILKNWRQQVYSHVHHYLKAGDRILEINAGTGIDALHFCLLGHQVHATDLSGSMVGEINRKIETHGLKNRFTCEQLSYDQLGKLNGRQFDYLFSNFGGLNCIQDLTRVTKDLPAILTPGAFVTWVIMPPISALELLGLLRGSKTALRRLGKNGTVAHLEGEHFTTYYHSLESIKKAFGDKFRFVRSEGLGVMSPAPHSDIRMQKRPSLYHLLSRIDSSVRNVFPFNRCGDHIIVTFQYKAA